MSSDYRLTITLQNSYKRILDIQYDLSVFHLKYMLSIYTYKSHEYSMYYVKCIDKSYVKFIILDANLVLGIIMLKVSKYIGLAHPPVWNTRTV